MVTLSQYGKIDVVEQSPLTLRGQKSHCNGEDRKNQANREGIEAQDHEVCKPSALLWNSPNAAWRQCLQYSHDAEDAEKESKANTRLALHRRPNTMVHPVALSRQSLTNRANQLIMLRNARDVSWPLRSAPSKLVAHLHISIVIFPEHPEHACRTAASEDVCTYRRPDVIGEIVFDLRI